MNTEDTQQPNDDAELTALFEQSRAELEHDRAVETMRSVVRAQMREIAMFYAENDMTDDDKAVFRAMHRDLAAAGAHRHLRDE